MLTSLKWPQAFLKCLKAFLYKPSRFTYHQFRTFIFWKLSTFFANKSLASENESIKSIANEIFTGEPYIKLDAFWFKDMPLAKDRYMFVCEYFEIVPDDYYFPKYNIYNPASKGFFTEKNGSILSWSRGGSYEEGQVQILPGDIVLDVGANIGIFSLLAIKKGAIVHAFEPQEDIFNILNDNIKKNNVQSSISTYQKAVSAENTTVTLYEMPNNHLGASLVMEHGNNGKLVESVTLDGWYAESGLSRIDFIKADIEGAERLMLDGAVKILKEFKPKLAICTYHFASDPEILADKIMSANPDYKVFQGKTKLYAW